MVRVKCLFLSDTYAFVTLFSGLAKRRTELFVSERGYANSSTTRTGERIQREREKRQNEMKTHSVICYSAKPKVRWDCNFITKLTDWLTDEQTKSHPCWFETSHRRLVFGVQVQVLQPGIPSVPQNLLQTVLEGHLVCDEKYRQPVRIGLTQ